MEHTELLGRLEVCAAELKKNRTDVQRIYLFGSSSGREYDLMEGIDLLIVISMDGRRWEDRVSEFQGYFSDIPVPVDVFPLTDEEVRRAVDSKDGFLGSMLKQKTEIGARPRK